MLLELQFFHRSTLQVDTRKSILDYDTFSVALAYDIITVASQSGAVGLTGRCLWVFSLPLMKFHLSAGSSQEAM